MEGNAHCILIVHTAEWKVMHTVSTTLYLLRIHTAYCLLHTAYYLLHTTYCISILHIHSAYYISILPTAYCILHTTYTAYCLLHPTHYILHTAYYILHTTYYGVLMLLVGRARCRDMEAMHTAYSFPYCILRTA
jgi:hypothetical protein